MKEHERTTWAGSTTGKLCTVCGKPAQVTKWKEQAVAVPAVRLCHEHHSMSISEVLEAIAGTWNETILAREQEAHYLTAFFARVPEMAEVQKYSDRMTAAQAKDIWNAFEDLIG